MVGGWGGKYECYRNPDAGIKDKIKGMRRSNSVIQ